MAPAPLDDAPATFSAFERELKKRSAKTTSRAEDVNRIRALYETWVRDYLPQFRAVLGEFPALEAVTNQFSELRGKVGRPLDVADTRRTLRDVSRLLDRDVLTAYAAARWSVAAAPNTTASTDDPLVGRLAAVNPDLADSYRQVLSDLGDDRRLSYLGPAGELREVLRGAIHALATDQDVRAASWFKGDDRGRPTQAERIRFLVERNSVAPDSPAQAAETAELKIGALGRTLYGRASKAFHAGTEREEVLRILRYVQAVLHEVLP